MLVSWFNIECLPQMDSSSKPSLISNHRNIINYLIVLGLNISFKYLHKNGAY